MFLRGYGGQTSYHYGAVGHWSAGLGELQGDAIRNITGTHSSEVLIVGATTSWGTTGAFYNAGGSGGEHIRSGDFHPGEQIRGFDASRVTPVAQEIRPVNRSGLFEEAFMYCVPRPKLRMQVPPRCACFHNPQDSIKYQAVVFTFASSGFSTGLRQHRPDYGPLFVGNVVSAHGKTKAADRRKVEILFRNSP